MVTGIFALQHPAWCRDWLAYSRFLWALEPTEPQGSQLCSGLAAYGGADMQQDREMIPNLDNCRRQGTCLPWAKPGVFRAVVHLEIST